MKYLVDNQGLRFIQRIELDLADVRDRFEITVFGDSLSVESIDGEADIHFNDDDVNYVELDRTRKVYMDFWRIFITNAAQAGKTLVILVGRQGVFDGVSDIALASNQGLGFNLAVGDDVLLSNMNSQAVAGIVESKKYQFTMLQSGIVRVKFLLKQFVAGWTAYAYIKVNGVQIGPTHDEAGQVYVPQQVDVPIGEGDLLQIWMNNSGAAGQSWVDDVEICGETSLGIPEIGVDSMT